MSDFMIRFLICNILFCGIISILLLMKHILKNCLSSRMQYNLWFLLLGLLTVPFLPSHFFKFSELFFGFTNLKFLPSAATKNASAPPLHTNIAGAKDWMDDFALSVNEASSSAIGYLLFTLWILGIIIMIILAIRSALFLHSLKKSASPLEDQDVQKLYRRCLNDTNITKSIPVYSAAYLKSPVIAGFWKPCIFLPVHLISDKNETDIRYMLLHELQHYKHKDGFINYLINLAGMIYWFNPFVWYALKEMRGDREIACDSSVLNLLKSDDYVTYGNTLINFAEKISLTPFPFSSGIGGNMKQMKRRILNIASYEKPTLQKKLKSFIAFLMISILLFGLTPFVSTYATDEKQYQWNTTSKNCSEIDLRNYFGKYEGSFVLYDLKRDVWKIHNIDRAVLRVAPNSTYKIYDALFGLEEGVITPANSLIKWNGKNYPFEAWNTDQTLQSAMGASVNWYFQTIDERLGADSIQKYLHQIGYGNENLSGNLKSSETAEETNFLCFLCCFNFMSYYPFCMLLYNSSNHLYKQVYILLPSSHPVNWDIKTYKLIFYINMREPLYAGTPACPFLIIFNDNDVLYWKQNVFSILLKFFNLNFSLLLPFHQTVSIFHTLISHLLIT